MSNNAKEAFLKSRGEKGIALVWTAIMLLTLLLFTGISIDFARGYLVAHQLQNAADAAALAGAQLVKRGNDPNTRDRTYKFAHANYYLGGSLVVLDRNEDPWNAEDGDIVIGNYDLNTKVFTRITTPTDDANAVKVVARCNGVSNPSLPLIFGPIAGVSTVNIERYAIALAKDDLGAGLLVLSENCADQPSLRFMGRPTVEIKEGSIQVNMKKGCFCDAILVDGKATVYADKFNLVNECDSTDGYIFDPATGLKVTPKQPRIPDPYADMLPPPNGPSVARIGNRFVPGYYPNGISITGSDDVVFEPGIYVLDGEIKPDKQASGGLKINGGRICAQRVMFYIKGGSVNIAGDPNMTITELVGIGDAGNPDKDFCPGATSTDYPAGTDLLAYEGMAIFQSRTNTSLSDIQGGSNMEIRGTIYFPNNHLDLGGTPTSLGIQVIAYTLTIHGTGSGDKLIINYDGRNRIPANASYLVK